MRPKGANHCMKRKKQATFTRIKGLPRDAAPLNPNDAPLDIDRRAILYGDSRNNMYAIRLEVVAYKILSAIKGVPNA